jgi:hypothetical protein
VARLLLNKQISENPVLDTYLTELQEFSLLRKMDLINTSQLVRREFHFDFAMLLKENFLPDPMKTGFAPKLVEIRT